MRFKQARGVTATVYSAAVLCVAFGVISVWIIPPERTAQQQVWYYNVDSRKLAVGAAHRVPPIIQDGNTYVRAVIYACSGSRPYVHHLEKFVLSKDGKPVRLITTPDRLVRGAAWISQNGSRQQYRKIQKRPTCDESARAPLQVLPQFVGPDKRWQRSEIVLQPRD